jgi:hypothetical protein
MVLGCLISLSNPVAASGYVINGSTTLSGSASITHFKTTHNNVEFPDVEVMIGANTLISKDLSFYASTYITDKDQIINSAFFRYETLLKKDMIEVEVGRVHNNYGLYNEKRSSPTSRGVIILPQAIYWDVMGQLSVFSDGVNLKYKTKEGLSFNYSYTAPRITDSQPFNTIFNIPGVVSGRFSGSYGLSYTYNNFKFNAQEINWRIYNSTFEKKQWIKLRNIGILYTTEDMLASAEYSTVITSLMKDDSQAPTQGVSYTLAKQLSDNLQLRLNYNKATLHNDWFKAYYPAVGLATDKNIGFNYKDLSSNWFVRAEYHHVTGGLWLPNRGDLSDIVKKWKLFAVQVGYNF